MIGGAAAAAAAPAGVEGAELGAESANPSAGSSSGSIFSAVELNSPGISSGSMSLPLPLPSLPSLMRAEVVAGVVAIELRRCVGGGGIFSGTLTGNIFLSFCNSRQQAEPTSTSKPAPPIHEANDDQAEAGAAAAGEAMEEAE